MKPIDQPAQLREYYQDGEVVSDYLQRRTTQPLNGTLHAGQVQFLNDVIAQRAPQAVLEIAPGPARLTAEICQVPFGVAAEFSPGMLASARQRVYAAGKSWSFVRADAFALPLRDHCFDLVFSLRFVRHFGDRDRARLYGAIHRLLRPGGALVLDAQNRAVRDAGHVNRHAVFDELYTAESLRRELESHGFRPILLEGVIKHHSVQRTLNRLRAFGLAAAARLLIDALERIPSRNPSTWMVLCERG